MYPAKNKQTKTLPSYKSKSVINLNPGDYFEKTIIGNKRNFY